jgi:hypothetical protein
MSKPVAEQKVVAASHKQQPKKNHLQDGGGFNQEPDKTYFL